MPRGTVEKLIQAAQEGSLVTISWHWNAPMHLLDKELVDDRGKRWTPAGTRASTPTRRPSMWPQALANPDSEEYRLLVHDIDSIAGELKKLLRMRACRYCGGRCTRPRANGSGGAQGPGGDEQAVAVCMSG